MDMTKQRMSLEEVLDDLRNNEGRRFRQLPDAEQLDFHLQWERMLESRSKRRRLVAYLVIAALAALPLVFHGELLDFLQMGRAGLALLVLHGACAVLSVYLVRVRWRFKARSRETLAALYALHERHRLNAVLH